jgi:hypothetical protein
LGVILEIDGLNTANSQEVSGTSSDAKWVFDPKGSYAIAGWQSTQQQALEFYFTLPEDSYSPLKHKVGEINAYVFFEAPPTTIAICFDVATGAGTMIEQEVEYVEFTPATQGPAEKITVQYRRRQAVLGITCQDTPGAGVKIVRVVSGGTAQTHGLQVGDIITYADGQFITSCVQIKNIIQSKSPGDYLILKIHRSTGTLVIAVKLGG